MTRNLYLFIFGASLPLLSLAVLCFFILWVSLSAHYLGKRPWRDVNILLFAVALFFVLRYTVLFRTPNESYYISFSLLEKLRKVKDSWDLDREIFMNALLFFPLGLSVPQLIYRVNAWKTFRNTILFAFLLSFCIEFLQYVLSSGTAELSDLLLNTSGAAIGALPVLIAGKIKKHS